MGKKGQIQKAQDNQARLGEKKIRLDLETQENQARLGQKWENQGRLYENRKIRLDYAKLGKLG